MKHRARNRRLLLSLVAVSAVAAGLVAASALGASPARNQSSPPGRIAALKKQNARLRAANKRLRQYSPTGIARQLATVKAALDKYQSVDQAKADGYAIASPCTFLPAGTGNASSDQGGMGVHFMNQPVVVSGKLDPNKPAILVYQPTTGGGFQLVAAEYFKPDADQNTATEGDRPTLFGRAFEGPMLGHGPGMPIHYDLHVWLWKHNPSGMFAPWNPDVSCSG